VMSISWGAMTWVNQPRHWRWDGPDLYVRTEHGSDFWRVTAHGYSHDTGHAFLAHEQGDLGVEVTVTADYAEQHDQAGLMVRLGPAMWLKAGVQMVDGALVASTVNTRDVSDWSVLPVPGLEVGDPVRLRVARVGDTVRVDCAVADGPWHLMRLAHFPAELPTWLGPMCSSPRRSGLEVHFADCRIDVGRPSWAWPAG